MEDGTSLYEEPCIDGEELLPPCDVSKSSRRGGKRSRKSTERTLRPSSLRSAKSEDAGLHTLAPSALQSLLMPSSAKSAPFTHKLVFPQENHAVLYALPKATLDLLGLSVPTFQTLTDSDSKPDTAPDTAPDTTQSLDFLCAAHADAPGWAKVRGGLQGAVERANATLDLALYLPGCDAVPYESCGLFANAMQEVWALTTSDPPCTCP